MNTRRRRRRLIGAVSAVLVGTILPSGRAAAAVEPTDYRSVLVAVEPATDTVTVDLVGDGTFVELAVERGTEVVVVGYFEEPYLRFDADGTVAVNVRSPTSVQNASRDGSTVIDATVSADDPPEWVNVATDGRYVWHDHRVHWMSPGPPRGAERGDRVSDQVISLIVDDGPVDVRVAIVWEAAPSRLPVIFGAALGILVVLLSMWITQRTAVALIIFGIAAAAVGGWQFLSLPAETGPSPFSFVIPLVAAASGVVALLLRGSLTSHGFLVLGGLELAAWVYLRLDWLRRAVLPTDAPFWLDRTVIAGSAVASLAAIATGVIGLLRPAPATATQTR